MGLDVYLYRYEDHADTARREEQYEERSSAVWGGYPKWESMTEEQRDEARAKSNAIAEELGLDDCGSDKRLKTHVELDSTAGGKDHYFKVGYFRSSYNDGGIDRVTGRILGVRGLYDIFPEQENGYCFQPDWAAAKQRALDMAEALERRAAETPFDVVRISHNPFIEPDKLPGDENAALLAFLQTRDAHSKRPSAVGGSFSNGTGDFFLDEPLRVHACISGTMGALFRSGREPVTYLVVDSKKENIDWYVTALKIVAETCDYVLGQPDPQKYYLHWSS